MKKILAIILCAFMLIPCLAGCTAKEELVIGYTDYKPMNYVDENGKLAWTNPIFLDGRKED